MATISPIDTNQTDKLIEQLKNSPLFNLSLGSKELFHSNFLAWLGENNITRSIFIEILKKLLNNSDKSNWIFGFENNPNQYVIQREFKHFDLCVLKNNNPVFILENKVKSIPTFEQLDKYSQKIDQNNSNCCFVLLTLIDDFVDKEIIENNGWIIVTYKDFAQCLNNISFHQNSYIHYLIDDYRLFVNALNDISDNWVISDCYLLNNNISQKLGYLRIVDLAEKLQVCRLFMVLIKEIEDNNIASRNNCRPLFWKLNNGNMKIAVGYSNKSALLDIVLFLDKNNDIKSIKNNINTLHIQLQGEQYRHAYEFEINKTQFDRLSKIKSRTLQYNTVVKQIAEQNQDLNKYKSWITNSDKANNKIFESSKIMPSHEYYNSFKGNGNGECSLFIYQYHKIKKDARIADVVKYITDDVKYLKKYVNY